MREQPVLVCPCCKQIRSAKEHRYFTDTVLDKYYTNDQGEKRERVYWVDLKRDSLTWACDECLQNGRALKANPMKQNFCDCQPHFAYFDRVASCRDCNQEFVFSKEEQYHWYEKLGLLVQARQVRCPSCRVIKKLTDKFNLLLSTADYGDSVKVEETVKLGIRQQQYQQVKHFLAVGKRKYKTKSTTFRWLEKLQLMVEEAEKASEAGARSE